MRSNAYADASLAFDLPPKGLRPGCAAVKSNRRHPHDEIVWRTGHYASNRIENVLANDLGTSHERLIAHCLSIRSEYSTIMVGNAEWPHHFEIGLNNGVGRRSNHAEFAPPTQNIAHNRPAT